MIERPLGHMYVANEYVRIVESRIPNEVLQDWINRLDAEAKRTYRHTPNMDREIQWFAYAPNKDNPEVTDRLVAYGSLESVGDQDEVVFGCVVDRDYRGVGLGKLMYRFATDLAIRYRRRAIIAEQDHDNKPARHICEEEDFEFSEPADDPTSSSGKSVKLRKALKWHDPPMGRPLHELE